MLKTIQVSIEAGPHGGAGAPDICTGLDGRRIVEGSQAHDRESGAARRVCEKVAATLGAEATKNLIAAVGGSRVLSWAARYLDC